MFSDYLRFVYPELCERGANESDSPDIDAYFNRFSAQPLTRLPEEPRSIPERLQVIASLPRRHVPPSVEKPVVVILAAGKGSRMGTETRQKSLCPIAGRPALLHAMSMYRSFGIERFVIVLGVGYREVIQCIGADREDVTFLFQDEQLGTGHAGRLAARYLHFCSYRGDVLIAMGDKFITHRGIESLFRDHAEKQPDLTISTASKTAWPDSGRVFLDESGCVTAIVEKPDIIQKQLMHDFYHWPDDPVPCTDFRERVKGYGDRPEKLRKLLGPSFWTALNDRDTVSKEIDGLPLGPDELHFDISGSRPLSGHELESMCDRVNISVYLFRAEALYESTERLKADNAQGELYLTDAVLDLTTHCNPHPYTIAASPMPDDYDVMGFNTSEELKQIERIVAERGLLDGSIIGQVENT